MESVGEGRRNVGKAETNFGSMKLPENMKNRRLDWVIFQSWVRPVWSWESWDGKFVSIFESERIGGFVGQKIRCGWRRWKRASWFWDMRCWRHSTPIRDRTSRVPVVSSFITSLKEENGEEVEDSSYSLWRLRDYYGGHKWLLKRRSERCENLGEQCMSRNVQQSCFLSDNCGMRDEEVRWVWSILRRRKRLREKKTHLKKTIGDRVILIAFSLLEACCF